IGAALISGEVYLKGYTLEKMGQSYRFTLNRGGVYLMNPLPNHPHYGCLMFCPFQIEQPFPADDPQALTPLVMRKTNCFLHGDYDLYGIVSADAPERTTVVYGIQHGVKNLYSERFAEIRDFLNRSIGVPMIQHGPQENIEHADDHLDVFWANGDLTEVRGRAAIEKLYLTEFHGRKTGPQTAPLVHQR
ncbi:MAG TPA: hypothetical protein VES73_06705, partial [Lamprocystis sp. (in: g-proteobacteria)]|nr:hypothetical protein [Lamprocystis sp. (in: g-proteobacteria)]